MAVVGNMSVKSGMDRRALLAIPIVAGAAYLLLRNPSRHSPDPAAEGTGLPVDLLLCADNGAPLGVRRLRRIVKTEAQWRSELSPESFAVTRHGATEFAFANRYWQNGEVGLYRCVCCGTALFRSVDKFDSGTGWPSFTAPAAPSNIETRDDHSLAEVRKEVLCRKCGAHLGHVFPDGPLPTGLRYCLNSAALIFIDAQRH